MIARPLPVKMLPLIRNVKANAIAIGVQAGFEGRTGSEARVVHGVTFIGVSFDEVLKKRDRFLCGMITGFANFKFLD